MSTVHPDDELLSAALDGGEEETAAHARGCPDCQLRLARLRAAAEAVASPVPAVSTAVRAAAVRRAMQEGGADLSGRRATRRRAQRRRAHRRLPGWAPVAALAAAAAVAAVVAVPIVLSGSGPSTLSATRATKAGTGPAAPAALDGGDLGSMSDQVALRDDVRQQLAAASAAGAQPYAQAAVPGQVAQGAQGPAVSSGSAAPGAAGPESQGPPSSLPPTRPLTGAPRCRAAAEQYSTSGLGTLVYVSSVHWQGTPGEVLLFRAAGGSLPYRLFVMARDGCQLLVVQSF